MKIIAAFIFFTRLPLWKWFTPNKNDYNNLVSFWSLTGCFTGAFAAAILYFSSLVLPFSASIILALISRVLLTGALHEDGFADFFDGFGGGINKDKILSIMKDSHIGTYGVLSLILYFLLIFTLLYSLPLNVAVSLLFVSDPASKFISSNLINFLPYSRKEDESKNKIIYNKMSFIELFISLFFGILPALLLFTPIYFLSFILPCLFMFFIIGYLNKKINGYTGDCCGAVFLITQLLFIINFIVIFNLNY